MSSVEAAADGEVGDAGENEDVGADAADGTAEGLLLVDILNKSTSSTTKTAQPTLATALGQGRPAPLRP